MYSSIPGVNIFGYFYAESGVGEHARQLVEAVRQADIAYAAVPFTRTLTRQRYPFDNLGSQSPRFPITIVAVNADEFPHFVREVGEEFLESTYTIGLWAWEIEHFSAAMASSEDLLDEIWANSSFAAGAIQRQVSRPVYSFPLPVAVPPVTPVTRAEIGLPEGFLFLFCFDFASVFERKNPIAAIEAFRQAFPAEEDMLLVLKSTNGDRFPDKLDELRFAADGDERISIIDGYWPIERVRGLMTTSNAYVSLHRSEGFGLTLAEAMAYEKPVVGTCYSGNLDFMTEHNSYLVPATLVEIPPGCDPYPPGALWGEPDLAEAARLMKRIVAKPEEAQEKARRARGEIEGHHSPRARGEFIRSRLEAASRKLKHLTPQTRVSPPPSLDLDDREDHMGHQTPLAKTEEPSVGDAIDHAVARMSAGPDLETRSRFGIIGLWLRRLVFRLLRNYHLYQREVGHLLVQTLREQRDQIDEIGERLDSLEQRIDGIEAKSVTPGTQLQNTR